MTGVPVSAEGPSTPWLILNRAAVELGERAGKATPGPWREDEPIDCQPSVIGPQDQWVAECGPRSDTTAPNGKGDHDASWIALLSPDRAGPLVDWLLAEARFVRRNIKHMHGDVEHLPSMRFARQILNEETS